MADPVPPAAQRPPRGAAGWFADRRLIDKTRLGLAALALIYLSACIVFLLTQRREQEARDRITHTYEVLSSAERIDAGLLSMRYTLREGLLTDQAGRTGDYRRERTRFDDTLERLVALTADNSLQQARLLRLHSELALWNRAFADPALVWLSSLESKPANAPRLRERSEVLDLLSAGTPHMVAMREVLQALEVEERRLLGERIALLERLNRFSFQIMLAVVFSIALAGTLLRVAVDRSVVRPLERLTALMGAIASGRRAVAIPHTVRADEVGALARALVALNTLVQERGEEQWRRTRLAELAVGLQLANDHVGFGDTLLGHLCTWIEAGYGLAYRWDDDRHRLVACAGYGVSPTIWMHRSFALGEGPLGQSARDQRRLRVGALPAAHFQILSGLGAGAPDTLLFVPLVSRGEIVGALELASLGAFPEHTEALLDELAGPTALAWQTLARSLKTQELLAVTRTQAEELQASEEALRIQQEELQSTNEALRSRGVQLEEQSERLRASEEELRSQAEELQLANDTLRLRTQDLETAQRELEQRAVELERASRYKSEFLANMSHELRTPLNSMLILSKSLADNDEGNLSAEQIESASIVHDSGRNLLQLINDILDLAKVEAGRLQVLPEELRLADCAAQQERNFRHVARTRGLDFTVELAADLPATIRTDGARLGQILANLLSNAFKFTSQGGVALRIERAPAERLRRPGLRPGHSLLFTVSDTGIGIPADKLDQVFRPFEQAESGTSRRYGGTGLGLSIVRGMVGLLGGDVFVESTPGQGSRFMVVLPDTLAEGGDETLASAVAALPPPALAATPMRLPESAPVPPVPAGAPAAVVAVPQAPALLVVEDDAAFAAILRGLGERKGLPVVIAATGAQALQAAARQPLLGVLLDLGLPDMSGWDVLERLRATPSTQNVPVHIISAADDTGRGRDLGAIGALTKPVTREAVLDVMQQIVDLRGAAPAGQPRVLVVDDDPGARAAVRKLLERETTRIDEAGNGADVEAALAAHHYDCMILDLGLPDVGGLDLLERLARHGPLPPVVVYSGRDLDEDENLRLRQYAESIVIKGARSSERLLDEVSLFLHALGRRDAATAASVADTPRDVAGKHVLIVDDDMRNIFALSKALRGRKLRVTMAQDGHKALAQLDAQPDIDLVLMDVMMPGMDGYEAMRRIRADERWKTLPIIAVTAKAMSGDREKCLEAGANDYCPKPIDIERLMSQIRVWI